MNRPATPRSSSDALNEQEDLRELRGYVPTGSAIDQEAARWQLRVEQGLDAGDQACLQAWLAAAPDHAAAFARHRALSEELGALPAEGVHALRAGLPRRPARQATDAARRAWWGRTVRWVPQVGVAALVCAVVGAGWLGHAWWQQQPVFTQSYATARGQALAVTLPDGSTLQLDTATRAEVTLYRDRREVALPEGQALFAVQKDAARPFDVVAGPVRITVVGTRFAVRHTAGDAGVRIAVEEGRVRVAAPADADAGLLLAAGQAFVAGSDGEPGTVSAVARGGVAPWREGRVAFDDTPLAQALAEFERYGDTRLRITDPAVGALRLSGSFDVRNADSFARAIQRMLPVRLRAQGGQMEIVLLR